MKRNIQRLGFAAFLSLTCFGATSYWYHRTDLNNSSNSGKKPIAYVDRTKDEIQRRPVTRIIWQLINDGDPVFPGEAIRTSSIGEVRINFADSSRFIDLEPDSLIVITQSANKEISLDLMDGGLMVNQGNTGANTASQDPGLKLKTGNASVDLSHATASLSKSGSNIDLQVLKGQAKVKTADGQSKELESGKSGALGSDGIKFDSAHLQILSPSLIKPVSQDPTRPQAISFIWKGFPAKSLVTLEIGRTRKEIKPAGESPEEKISVKLPSGKHFWKLVARDPESRKVLGESPVYRLEIVNRFPPVLLSPGVNERVLKTQKDQAIEFRWTRPDQVRSLLLEVARDEYLKSKVLTQVFTTDDDSLSKSLPDGTYYARMSAAFGDETKYFSGKVQKFSVTSKILEPVKVEWLKEASEKILLPFSGPAAAPLQWNSKQKEQIKIWRIKWAENEIDLSGQKAQTFETRDLSYQLAFKKPGRYIAMVEAVDEANIVVASSTPKTIDVELPPLLEAPHLQPEQGDLKADSQGNLTLQWNSIEGAKEYALEMIRPNSKEGKSTKVTKTSATLVNLLPGKFQVHITAIDQFGRPGAQETRDVVVPDTSGLATPKVKRIKVK